MSIDIEQQYDKIYRYCYFKLRDRDVSEDITQETFLRFLEKYSGLRSESALKCLYTIARNLCIDEYRKPHMEPVEESMTDIAWEDRALTNLAVRNALSKLDADEQELLLLRYVNEVPVGAIGKILGVSRFSVHRKLSSASKRFEEELWKEEDHGSLER